MLLQNVFCTRLMPADRPLKAAFAIFPTPGSRHHKYDTNVCKKGRTPMYTIDFTKPEEYNMLKRQKETKGSDYYDAGKRS